ncbi:hypothetical protein [Cupriavidus necator]
MRKPTKAAPSRGKIKEIFSPGGSKDSKIDKYSQIWPKTEPFAAHNDRDDVLQLIESTLALHLAAGDALPAFIDILVEKAGEFSKDDLTTFTAIGSAPSRTAESVRGTRVPLDRVKVGSRRS